MEVVASGLEGTSLGSREEVLQASVVGASSSGTLGVEEEVVIEEHLACPSSPCPSSSIAGKALLLLCPCLQILDSSSRTAVPDTLHLLSVEITIAVNPGTPAGCLGKRAASVAASSAGNLKKGTETFNLGTRTGYSQTQTSSQSARLPCPSTVTSSRLAVPSLKASLSKPADWDFQTSWG